MATEAQRYLANWQNEVPSVFELCDQVCGGVRRQLQELDALLQTAEQPAAARE